MKPDQNGKKLKPFYVTDDRSLKIVAKSETAFRKVLFNDQYADNWDLIQATNLRSAAREFAVRLGFGEENYERLTLYVRPEGVEPWDVMRVVVEVTVTVRYRVSAGDKIFPSRRR